MKMNIPKKSKISNYLKELLVSEKFNVEIVKIRKKYGIPEYGLGGFDPKAEFMFNYPDNWLYYRNVKYINKFSVQVTKFCEMQHLNTIDLVLSVKFYIFYNEFRIPDTQMCILEDIIADKEEIADLPPDQTNYQKINKVDKQYPVAIRINPYATQRDIISFIRKNYAPIMSLQKWHKQDVPVGKYRNRNPLIEKRNEYIYNNRKLPLKDIKASLAEKEIYMDTGEIGKIISTELKRRK